MAIKRIKSTWHESERNAPASKSHEDTASALGFILWRVALESAKDLHRERFNYRSDQQRVAVIAEFLAFLVQVTDRLVYDLMGLEERTALINALGRRLGDHLEDNLTDLFGPGDYRAPFIETLNRRLADYADLSFEDGEPGYDFLRYFGDRVLKVMGEDQSNRWVIDQIMDLSGPEAAGHVRRSVQNLLASPPA